MFKKIMAPVDLAHMDRLEKALKCTADLAKHYDAEVIFVGVTSSTPSSMAHTPAEYAESSTRSRKIRDRPTASPRQATRWSATIRVPTWTTSC